MTGSSLQFFIFHKNAPWGVIRKADGSLVYKQVMRFENEELRNDFIVNRLLTTAQKSIIVNNDWTPLLNNSPFVAYTYLSDTRIHIKATPEQTGLTYNKLLKVDFCAVKLGDETLFYALKLIKASPKLVIFECELDIFFTHKIEFREESTNFIKRAHVDRVKKYEGYIQNDTLMPNTPISGAYKFNHFLNIPYFYNNDDPHFSNLNKTSHHPLKKHQKNELKAQEDVVWMLMYQTYRGELK